MNLSLYEIRLFIILFITQLTVYCDTLILSFAEFGNFPRRETSTMLMFALGQSKFFRFDILTPSHFANQIKFIVRQIHYEKEKILTQSSIKKVNPNDVTASITVTSKIHSQDYNFMEY